MHQLRREPLCAYCKLEGRVEVATVVDHIKAHGGDQASFWDTTNLQSLCEPHHNEKTRAEQDAKRPLMKGCDTAGMPLDKRHWAYDERS